MNASVPSQDRESPNVTIRSLREDDLPLADRIMRIAFGTFLGLPDPLKFMGDADYIRTRWLADPSAAFGAELGGELVGTVFAARWGSVAFFGPLTIVPELWNRGVAQALLRPTMDLFDQWGVTHAGLFTFANSAKHANLYQKFGFWPRFLTCLMEIPVESRNVLSDGERTAFSEIPSDKREHTLEECRALTNSIYEGLDVEREIRAAADQKLGDAVMTRHDGELTGMAVCHVGAGTEAGSGKSYIKFGAVRSGPGAAREFQRLVDACRDFACARGARMLTAGVNLARLDAYREMLRMGFRTTAQGVAMERNGAPGYNRPEVFLIDDWR